MRATQDDDWFQIGNYEFKRTENLKSKLASIGLSPRERETLCLFCKGRSREQVAAEMNISIHTVDTFKRRIFEKLDVNTMVEAVALAIAFLGAVEVRKTCASQGSNQAQSESAVELS